MKTLERYITGIFLKNFFFSWIAIGALFLFQAMFSDLYDHRDTIHQILVYYGMGIPETLVQMAPPAVLLSTVLTLSGLTRTQELVACYSIGFGLRRIMSLLLGTVFILVSCLLMAQDRILPPVSRLRMSYKWQMEKRTDFFLDIKRDKIWYRSKNMIYNLQRFDAESKTIYGMSVYTFDGNFNLAQVISAEKAEFSPKGWKLIRGVVTIFAQEDAFPMTQEFAEKEILLSETPKDFQEIEKEVDTLRIKELYQYIQRMKRSGADTKSYEVKLHSRISSSFIPIVMCFLAIPFSLGSRREGGVAKGLGLCLGVTFFYWLFYSIGLSLGTSGVLSPWLAAWLPSIFFMALAAALVARKA